MHTCTDINRSLKNLNPESSRETPVKPLKMSKGWTVGRGLLWTFLQRKGLFLSVASPLQFFNKGLHSLDKGASL